LGEVFFVAFVIFPIFVMNRRRIGRQEDTHEA
jgi:hypothetical protein